MPSIQSLGAGSGLLTSDLVDQIVAAERSATDLRIQAELSAFGSLRNLTEKLQTSASALSVASNFDIRTAVSSDPGVVSVSATSAADIGSHSVEVTQLARAHTIASQAFASPDTIVGTGQLDFRFGTTTFSGSTYSGFTVNPDIPGGSVTISATNATLAGLRDAINDAALGVSASLIDDGSGFRLVLRSDQTGEDVSMEVVATEGTVPGLSAFAFNAGAATPGVNMEQTVAAADAQVEIDGITVSRASNTVTGALPGVTLNLLATNAGAPASVSVSRNVDAATQLVQSFVDDFNAVLDLTDQLTAFDPDTQEAGLLLGDPAVRGIVGQLRRALNEQVTSLGAGAARSLIDIGIETDQNDGFHLSFDASVMSAALNSDADAVTALFAEHGFATSGAVEYFGSTPLTSNGQYAVEITRAPTQGFVRGVAAALGGPLTVDAGNDDLMVTVDGESSGAIQLTQGNYADGNALAAEIERQINADAKLAAKGIEVMVSVDASNRLVITSQRFGSASRVDIDSVDVNTLADFGLDVSSGAPTAGLDVSGRIDGRPASGVDAVLTLGADLQAATSGLVRTGRSAIDAGSVTLDATNNNFTVQVDGVQSGTVNLTQQVYSSGAALAAELQAQINADANLAAAGKTVTVSYVANTGAFEITSASQGAGSSVVFDTVPAATDAIFGFGAGVGFSGTDAATTVSEAAGLQVKAASSSLGVSATLTFSRGVMSLFDAVLEGINGADGSLDSRTSTLDAALEDLDQEEADFETRMKAFEERLRSQFAAADALIAQLNATSEFITQQVALLPLTSRNQN